MSTYTKNENGFSVVNLLIVIAAIAIIIVLLFGFGKAGKIINTEQYEGLIIDRYDKRIGKTIDYYITVEGVNNEEIDFKISSSNYEALEVGYKIKFYGYHYEGDTNIHYDLGTPNSGGTIILITNNSVQTDSERNQ